VGETHIRRRFQHVLWFNYWIDETKLLRWFAWIKGCTTYYNKNDHAKFKCLDFRLDKVTKVIKYLDFKYAKNKNFIIFVMDWNEFNIWPVNTKTAGWSWIHSCLPMTKTVGLSHFMNAYWSWRPKVRVDLTVACGHKERRSELPSLLLVSCEDYRSERFS